MRIKLLSALFGGLFLLPAMVPAQSTQNACDLNGDGAVNTNDVNLAVSMSLGSASCTANIIGPAVCNVVVVQRVVNAMTGACVVGSGRSVLLNWVASISPNVAGYRVYRSTVKGGPYNLIAPNLVAAVNYTDSTVQLGQTYYYVVTAVDSNNNASVYSNEAESVIPTS
ncbi:MAG: hypothetical protein KJZ84_07015 [Bryobacteraceae bacterium]|nr:hypothetical protein [Bryobacteraceae bacterium]